MKPPIANVVATKKTSPGSPSGATLANVPAEKNVPPANPEPKPETRIENPETRIENNAELKAEAKPAEIKAPAEKPEAKPVETKAPAEKVFGKATLDKLFDYAFDVITGDARGKVASVEKGSRRYISDELPGGITLEMVEVTGGSFPMGSVESELNGNLKSYSRDLGKQTREKVLERLPAEGPQHVVKVPSFYMGKFEVTQAQWRAIAKLQKIKLNLNVEPSQFKDDNRPVENVSWDEAMEFCERLSRVTGRRYRLPTEAEWEYACRAGTESPFHYGPAIATAWANFDGKRPFLSSSSGESRQQTVVVGSLGGANAFGLYDMHGNVWEWCLDSWHENYLSAPEDGTAWRKGGAIYLRVLRGGSWDSAAVECRSGFRDRLTPNLKMNTIGFRLVAEGITTAEAR